MLFMVIEKFRNQDGKAVYRKLRDAGRGLPDGLKFVASYVTADLGRCFQLMETDDITLFQRWIADWQEVVEFEVVPVVEGKTTREALAPLLLSFSAISRDPPPWARTASCAWCRAGA